MNGLERMNAALSLQEVDRAPIWFMRQAGRYHSHYQKMRKKYSFIELCKNSELASDVAIGPINEFDYDLSLIHI